MEKYTAIVSQYFSAAHHIPRYPGNCCEIHGHNWEVVVAISRSQLDDTGLSVDLRLIKKELRKICDVLDHTDLNSNPHLVYKPPTAENIAKHVYDIIEESFPQGDVAWIEVKEGPTASIRYSRSCYRSLPIPSCIY